MLRFLRQRRMTEALPTRWSFQPSPWGSAIPLIAQENAGRQSTIGTGCTLFHDARQARVAWLQLPASPPDRRCPFSFEIHAPGFDGSYLSLAIAIPERFCRSIDRKSIISIELHALGTAELPASLRMNAKRGPNTYENWQPIKLLGPVQIVEFDMSNFGINPASAYNMWLDFMVTQSGSWQLAINALSMSHRHRLEF